ncbi:MAG: hypothetical protein EP350_04120 [Alphaproteobacteria bacterium]|nr:MAG: hypothetical protein EP350_04120 [Alphaproteobacteria bacterium]
MSSAIARLFGPAILSASILCVAMPAVAQDSVDEARLRKIEAEVRALQRKVFPGGDARFFEPEIAPAEQSQANPAPTSTAVTDILVRLDAIEAQLQRLTARSEENSNAIAELDTRVVALEPKPEPAPAQTESAPQVTATEAASAPSPAPNQTLAATPASAAPTTAKPAPAKPAQAQTSPATSQPAGPSPERIAAVQQIAKPQTEDAGDDEYSYGFRLWNAGFFPEAQQQLSLFVEKYPGHSRISYGRNLLGRAYLDDGKPSEAAPWFLRNYQTDKQGARAGDSLLFLAESMIALNDTKRACIALAEFSETYPALAAGRLLDQYEADRKKVTCN